MTGGGRVVLRKGSDRVESCEREEPIQRVHGCVAPERVL